MPTRPTPPGAYNEAVEHIRQGTRQQYESEWVLIPAGVSHGFLHDLGEIPWSTSIIKSLTQSGLQPSEASDDVTISYADVDGVGGTGERYVTVTNDLSEDYYFKLRAM